MRHSAELASWRRPAASAASAGDAPGHASPRAGLRRNADGEDARLLGDADHRSVDVEDERLADKYLHSLPYRSVCVSTRERLLVLLDFFQLFALLWSVSPPWPWPFRWMRDTRFALVANLDVFLLHNYEVAHGGNTPGQALRGRSIWGEYPDLPLLAGCAALLCACIMLAPVVQVWHLKRKEQHWLRPRRALVSKLLLLGELLLLPCALVLLRLLVCRGEEDVLDALPSVACLSWQHLLLASLAGLPLAVFVLGVPLALALRIWPLLVHASTQQHERWLRRKETEYVLFLSDDWLEDGFALTSSFRRPCALHRPAVAAVKLLLALVYALLRARPGVQGSAFFCAFTALLAVHVLARPFRSLSSTLLQLVLDAALVYFSCLGMFKATGLNNYMTVESNMYRSLLAGATLAGALVAIWLAVVARRRWQGRDRWPVTQRSAVAGVSAEWVAAVCEARDARKQARMCPRLLVPVHVLRGEIERLRRCAAEAARARHVLLGTMVETIDELALLIEECESVSMLPNAALEEALPGLAERLRSREQQLALVSPSKRRILSKLLAVRTWRALVLPRRPVALVVPAAASAADEALARREQELLQAARAERARTAQQQQAQARMSFIVSTRGDASPRPTTAAAAAAGSAAQAAAVTAAAVASAAELLALGEELEAESRAAMDAGTQAPLETLQALRQKWKRLIRRWEIDFAAVHGRDPAPRDKRTIKPWYQWHRTLTLAMEQAE